MRSLFENKRLILLLAVLALGALTVLALSLDEVPFREGQQFGWGEAGQAAQNPPEKLAWAEVPWWQQLGVWALLGVLAILVGLMLSPELRRILIRRFIQLALTFWGIVYLLENYRDVIPILNMEIAEEIQGAGSRELNPPPPMFTPPPVSPVFSYLISFAFALLALAVIWGLYRGWKKYLQFSTRQPLDEIARIARSSLDELSSGRESSDVIINCYLRMSEIVSTKRHLQREAAMTPREFAARLERAGLPGAAVTQLTGLFEGVRYGDRKSGPRDVKEAVNCLQTILQYCGEPV